MPDENLKAKLGDIAEDGKAHLPEKKPKPETKPKPGTAISFPEVEPWPETVDGTVLAREIVETVRGHVILEVHAARAVALWVLLTWTCNGARVLPLLAVQSPVPECGKTTLLELIGELVRRPLPASNISASSVFRVVEAFTPTLLVDEADTFLAGADELRGVLNSGHTRATAFVIRTVGEGANMEVRLFSTWGPKAIALIRELPETLARRSIRIRLERKLGSEQVAYLAAGDDTHRDLRRRVARWANDHPEAASSRPEVPGFLSNRKGDNWRPLLSIAAALGGDWPELTVEAARGLLGGWSADDDSIPALLLADLRAIFDAKQAEALPSSEIVEALAGREDRPWGEWGKQKKPITVHGLAAQLRHFKIAPKHIKLEGDDFRGYRRSYFEPVWARYLPEPGVPDRHPVTTGFTEPKTELPDRHREGDRVTLWNGDFPLHERDGDGVTLRHPEGEAAAAWDAEERDAFLLDALDAFPDSTVLPDQAGPIRTRAWMRRHGYPDDSLRRAREPQGAEEAAGPARIDGQLDIESGVDPT